MIREGLSVEAICGEVLAGCEVLQRSSLVADNVPAVVNEFYRCPAHENILSETRVNSGDYLDAYF